MMYPPTYSVMYQSVRSMFLCCTCPEICYYNNSFPGQINKLTLFSFNQEAF